MAVTERGRKPMPEVRRRLIASSGGGVVVPASALLEQTLPLVLKPALDGLRLTDWAADNREFIEAQLYKHGGLLFRGFDLRDVNGFERFINVASGAAIEYQERTSPRSRVGGNIYTATDHPADQNIFLHNEQSYNLSFPSLIFFFCVSPAERGGETILADTRKVYARIDSQIRERFARQGYMYVRNFGQGFGLTWQDAFQTTDRDAVALYCSEHGIEFEWKDGDCLRTRQVRRVEAAHPVTGEMVWFNHATFFHVTTLPPDIQRILLSAFGEEDLPNNTYYGDGSPIEPQVMEALREAYLQELLAVRLESGDALMLDNMLTSHGRAAFSGERKVVVGMSALRHWLEIK
ncbi:MAG TPA: TauD/TfdA family dioxygenase [Pyrinomonadaceae bacterium]|nr:TauD/TfdA family dioxygenase [Pyrinomonadaceae bacterium]